MTNIELANARQLLTLSQLDCAKLVGNVSIRAWRYWEFGERSIPTLVQERMYELLNARNTILNNTESLINEKIEGLGKDFAMNIVVYTNSNDFKGSKLELGVTNSVAISIYGKYYEHVNLISFNAESFEKWRLENNKEDSQETRSEWAALQ